MSIEKLIPAGTPSICYDIYEIAKNDNPNDYPKSVRGSLFGHHFLGFEDVIGGPLGIGTLDNTAGAAYQMIVALGLSPNSEVVRKIVDSHADSDTRQLVGDLRKEQVLNGMSVVDLGSGHRTFALSARMLGAKVATVDYDDTLERRLDYAKDGHISLDLREVSAALILLAKTGGNIDLVTCHMVDGLYPVHPDYTKKFDKESIIKHIALTLLRDGGNLHYEAYDLYEKAEKVLAK